MARQLLPLGTLAPGTMEWKSLSSLNRWQLRLAAIFPLQQAAVVAVVILEVIEAVAAVALVAAVVAAVLVAAAAAAVAVVQAVAVALAVAVVLVNLIHGRLRKRLPLLLIVQP